ncbi:peptidoglycan-binding protein [Erythrobacter sp. THAF29]|uniref:peptidoglycan-binding protein n=1 Tax=Erythrobacter sp. THAF29 TaxID=2587851 RepID=UPI001269189B|nr:peptidoglycan-binding protein [Erythrobacter sp. THAF29]QFT75994.1 Putative peptidoglycan binding domain protein [Erythrobacter sp. THAF29]
MNKSRFLISSLVAAGIAPMSQSDGRSVGDVFPQVSGPDPDDEVAVRRFAQDHRFQLAQHRSHSSHASHSSHRSGSSGRQRAPSYTPPPPRVPRATPTPTPVPAPTTTPTRNERSNPPSSILPASPATVPNRFYSPDTSAQPSRPAIEEVVCKVQTGLMAYGYYDGDLDCIVGPMTRAALKKFQEDYDLAETGTITPEVLDAFRIVAE